ncbi:Intraflagellar transport protein [Dirofilaria immitis]
MRLKVIIAREPKHEDSVLAVAWIRSNELVSVGDDQQVLKWNLVNSDVQVLMHLPSSLHPTCMQWLPYDYIKQQMNDIFILTSTEGKFYICNRKGRIEKIVEAHRGAILSGRWSNDGSTFATCGEDGAVKIWSRNGMLRSILLENSSPIYGICWNGNDSCIAFCCGENCFTKALKSQALIKWKGHDGIGLCIDWNANTNLLVSGGEDCKYKVWDEYGRPIYSSSPHDYPVTSVAWNADGDLFAVGSFNLLRLCDKAGWSHSLEKLITGTVYNISWSPDSTQLAGACSDGSVLHAYLVEKRITWRNIEAVQIKRQLIDIRDVLSNIAYEKLELRDRITKLSLGFEQLVVATISQCYIFSIKNWNTPIIMDLKECNVSLIMLCEKYFLLVDGSLMQVYNYEGRMQCLLKLPVMSISREAASEKIVAISNDTIAIRDRVNLKMVYFFETVTGKSVGNGKLSHTNDIIEIAIDQCGAANDRKLAFIDKCLDCFLVIVKTSGAVVTNIVFNDQTNMLAGLQDNRLVVWLYPAAVFIDRDLLQKTIFENDESDFGKSPYLHNFVGNHISVRRSDGALISCTITPFASALNLFISSNKWDQAIRLCRHIRENYLWAMLAVIATELKNFYAAEIAYTALDEIEKVKFLSHLRAEQNNEVRSAMMAAFTRNFKDADAMLVQNGYIFRALMLNISLFQWQRALELAIKYDMHLATVIGYRQKYLQEMGRKEINQDFLKYQSQVEIDWDHIQQAIFFVNSSNKILFHWNFSIPYSFNWNAKFLRNRVQRTYCAVNLKSDFSETDSRYCRASCRLQLAECREHLASIVTV